MSHKNQTRTNQTAGESAVDFVKQGSSLIKVRSKYSKNERYFQIEPNDGVLMYKGSKKHFCSEKKKSSRSRIYLSDIQEIRRGSASDGFTIAYGRRSSFPPDAHCFSLVIGEGGQMLDLVAASAIERDLWISGIEECRNHTQVKTTEVQQTWSRKLFHDADTDGNGELSLKEIVRILNMMNLDADEGQVAKIVGKKTLTAAEFVNFQNRILEGQEIVKVIFKKYDNGLMHWTKQDLHRFLSQEQGENLTLEQCAKMIDQLEMCPDFKKNNWLGVAGFAVFLESRQMNFKDPKCREIYQDMNQPLSHYFIDSSHNTYLESDQLRGYSKAECYVKVLKHGCRCVEMDVWDGDNMLPVICHGHTLTSKIQFLDVIQAVNKYAFYKTKCPLILSIENHCSVEQQRVMANMMISVFGEKLFLGDVVPNSNFLPPPSQLMGRIIIKCKKIPESSIESIRQRLPSAVRSNILGSMMITDAGAAAAAASVDSDDEPDTVEDIYEIAQEFSDCINICQTASFKSFEHSKANHNFQTILSFSEKRALKLSKKTPEDFIQHNKRQLSRIFPAGTRVGSTNYDPVPYWAVGCQVVALNYQTPDEPMQLNRGLFEDNGGCGYVLKPEFMRNFTSRTSFSPDSFLPNTSWHKTLLFKVLSGIWLPKKEGDSSKSILDPYVQVSIAGVARDKKTFKTKVITNNGFDPIWNEEFKFFITCPQLALLHIQVIDRETKQSDVVIAQYCLPVQCLQKGYRTVHLKSVSGEHLTSARLYVHIGIS